MTTTIALLSPGAMGSALGRRLVEGGARVLTSLVARGPQSVARAREAGMEDAPDDVLTGADLILSVVPPAEAEPLLRRLLPAAARAGNRPLYVDANALAPATKRRLAGLAEETGIAFVDACIIGGPQAPTLYAAGPDAQHAMLLGERGLDLRLLDGPVGAAAALKMCYSGINKGLVGLATAMLRAADQAGAAGALRDEMARSMPDLATRFARQVPDMYPKAGRWVAEMEEIAAFLGDDAGGATVFAGMARLYAAMAADDGTARAALTRALGEGA